MTRVEIAIREAELPADAEPMARLTLTTGTVLDLTLAEWREVGAWLELGKRDAAAHRFNAARGPLSETLP